MWTAYSRYMWEGCTTSSSILKSQKWTAAINLCKKDNNLHLWFIWCKTNNDSCCIDGCWLEHLASSKTWAGPAIQSMASIDKKARSWLMHVVPNISPKTILFGRLSYQDKLQTALNRLRLVQIPKQWTNYNSKKLHKAWAVKITIIYMFVYI